MRSTDCFLLRTPSRDQPGQPGIGIDTGTSEEKKESKSPHIRCRVCGNPVTQASERISINDSHIHTFANPSGILYEIGCFRSVTGCGFLGPETDAFSWFKGYRWKVAYCNRCLTHLGWLFVSPVNTPFSGLILDRLTDPE